jgi:hypothetical protein
MKSKVFTLFFTYGSIMQLHSAWEERDHKILAKHPNKSKQANVHAKLKE